MNKLFSSLFFLFAGIAIACAGGTNGDQPGTSAAPVKVSVTVYPNPTQDVVNVNFDGPVKTPIIETFNVNGQKVHAPQNGESDGSNKMEVDISDQAPGIYILQVISEGQLIHVQKIIKN